MIVVRSAGERFPLAFRGYSCVVSERVLDAGDYSLHGFEHEVAVVRLSPSELVANVTLRREQFSVSLERLRGFRSAAVAVEAPLRDILESGRILNGVSPEQVEQGVVSLTERYRMPFHFAASRSEAERYIFNFLRHFQADSILRYNALAESVHADPEKMLDETGRRILEERRNADLAEAKRRKDEQLRRNAEAVEIAEIGG